MEETEMMNLLREGFAAGETRFLPTAYLERVDEPEFGCEGRPEEGPIYGTVWGYTEDGPFKKQVEDWKIFTYGLDDGVWLGTPEGETGLFVWSKRRGRMWKLPEAPF